MCPAFRKVRKVTHEEAEMEELLKKKASARREHQRLTQEESLLQTYLNMVKINPAILEWRVAEKRRKDFGGTWAAHCHFRFMFLMYIRSYRCTGIMIHHDSMSQIDVRLFLLQLVGLSREDLEKHRFHWRVSPSICTRIQAVCIEGCTCTVVQTIGFFLVFPTAATHQAGIFHGMSWLHPSPVAHV